MNEARGEGPRRLPTGAHGIPAEIVARNQRERLYSATAEACAEKGYAETRVLDFTERAGISTSTFYELFAGKRECALEAHQELSARLEEEVDRVCGEAGGGEAGVRAAIRTVLELFAADPPTARLLTVEVLVLGPDGAERNDQAVAAFARRLAGSRGALGVEPTDADWAAVAGASMLIGRQVMAGEAAGLPGLVEELVAQLYRG